MKKDKDAKSKREAFMSFLEAPNKDETLNSDSKHVASDNEECTPFTNSDEDVYLNT